ncbi:MAG TPA: sugar phosphate isomerase/epimerase family protein [Pedobacter sp.]|nr:sugar phosphate isomerase/epimerase family protein [Pedobacter sp.]
MKENISRKTFIRSTAIVAASIPFGLKDLAASVEGKTNTPPVFAYAPTNSVVEKLSINIFSKHLHWLNYREMAVLANELGYDGIDLTVRDQGHVLPQNVEKDLPKAVDAIRNVGLEVHTITTDIKSADEKYTANILKAATAAGIKNYRMGWYEYSGKQEISTDLETFKVRLKRLAAINEKYQIHGDYENHTGRFGGPIWDLWLGMKELDPKWIGCQFDIRHASVDGAEAWPRNLDLIHRYLGSVTIKDFFWEKKDNKWSPSNVPLGQGMIDYPKYFGLLKKYQFQKPISQHFEYPLGGAESGSNKLSISKGEVIRHMQEDLVTLKTLLKGAQLI